MANRSTIRVYAYCFILLFSFQIFTPTFSFALTDGPAATDYTGFEPVSTTDMVDVASGGFTYNLPVINVPGAEGGGYALGLSYHSGVNSEMEASWVGLGWSLNPGVLNRGVQGVPDDYDGEQLIKKFTKAIPVWTVSSRLSGNLEVKSQDSGTKKGSGLEEGSDPSVLDPTWLSGGGSITTSYNNYTGFTRTRGYNVAVTGEAKTENIFNGFTGSLSLGAEQSGRKDWKYYGNVSVDVTALIKRAFKIKQGDEVPIAKEICGEQTKDDWAIRTPQHRPSGRMSLYSTPTQSLSKSLNDDATPTYTKAYSGQLNVTTVPFAFPLGIQVGNYASVSVHRPILSQDAKAYGYLNNQNLSVLESGSQSVDSEVTISDYYLERDASFTVDQDRYLPLPYHSNDMFLAVGEGVMGSFRFHRLDRGHYYPDLKSKRSEMEPSISGGFDLGFGTGFSFGTSIRIPILNRALVTNWLVDGETDNDDWQFSASAGAVARMSGDLAGNVIRDNEYDDLERIQYASLDKQFGRFNFEPEIKENDAYSELQASQIKRSTYIEKLTVNDERVNLNGSASNDVPGVLADFLNTVDQDDALNNLISGFKLTNTSGLTYEYRVPVFNHSEMNLMVDYKGSTGTVPNEHVFNSSTREPYVSSNVTPGYGAGYDNITSNNDLEPLEPNMIATGELNLNYYAGSHLLSAIKTDNYFDVGQDGLTDDDVGGFTAFKYRKVYGVGVDESNQTKWFKWRVPYTGGIYSKGDLVYERDDKISVSSGRKEVLYLKQIETKTHVALFVTNKTELNDFDESFSQGDLQSMSPATIALLEGSQDVRYDSFGAEYSNQNIDPGTLRDSDTEDLLEGNVNDHLSLENLGDLQPLEYLERIVLFKKDSYASPIKTVNFDYDFSLVRNLPNNINGGWPNNPDFQDSNGDDITPYDKSGKLTLKKVWFDYGGRISAKTSPFEFNYRYADIYGDPSDENSLAFEYPELKDFVGQYSYAEQNPDYNPYLLDAWGCMEYDYENRRQQHQNWKYQGIIDQETAVYDPAAYHLKQIKLPSGGEIHIHYEEGDYAFVQDEHAMAMVSLIEDDQIDGDRVFSVNLEDLGIDMDASDDEIDEQIANQIEVLNEVFKEQGRRIKYKFLFALNDNSTPTLDENSCSAYMQGYVPVSNITTEGSGANTRVLLATRSEVEYLPRTAAYYEFMQKYQGAYGNFSCSAEEFNGNNGVFANFRSDVEEGTSGIPSVMPQFLATGLPMFQGMPDYFDGTNIDYDHSYLRLPLAKKKRGGPVRVKRLISFDSGVLSQSGEKRVYGQQFTYELENGVSSGVTNNEPAEIAIENPLVSFIKRDEKSLFQRITTGKDRLQQEGPIGMMLYGGPRVVYSRIIVEDINNYTYSSGTKSVLPTSNGYQEHRFFTAREYPLKMKPTYEVDGEKIENPTEIMTNNGDRIHSKVNKLNLPLPYFLINTTKIFVSQGYMFETNKFHGVPRSMSIFSNAYEDAEDNDLLSYSKIYDYFEPGEKVNVLDYSEFETNPYKVRKAHLGVEEESAYYMDRTTDQSMNLSIEFDITFAFAPTGVTVTPTFGGDMDFYRSDMSRHVSNRVVEYGLIRKGETEYSQGVWKKFEHIAFDEDSGNPVITRSSDEFYADAPDEHNRDWIYTTNLPAHWYYETLGQKASDANNENILDLNALNILSYGSNGRPIPSDELITDAGVDAPWFNSPANVLKGAATTYRDSWYSESTEPLSIGQKYAIALAEEKGLDLTCSELSDPEEFACQANSYFLPYRTYKYEKDLNPEDINKFSGYTSTATIFSDWNNSSPYSPDDEWQLIQEASAYDVHKRALSELTPLKDADANQIFSSVQYGYNDDLPVAIASNAPSFSFIFQDFETSLAATDIAAHTGKMAFDLSQGSYTSGPSLLSSTSDIPSLEVAFWTKISQNELNQLSVNISGIEINLNRVCLVNGWALMMGEFDDVPSLGTTEEYFVNISYNGSSSNPVLIDDFKIAPSNCEIKCMVYDTESYRLLANFNDQHFSLQNRYNEEGKLIRRLIETERGLKVLDEANYNSPTVQR